MVSRPGLARPEKQVSCTCGSTGNFVSSLTQCNGAGAVPSMCLQLGASSKTLPSSLHDQVLLYAFLLQVPQHSPPACAAILTAARAPLISASAPLHHSAFPSEKAVTQAALFVLNSSRAAGILSFSTDEGSKRPHVQGCKHSRPAPPAC